MANNPNDRDNYVENKTWDEIMEGSAPEANPEDAAKVTSDRAKRATDKGAAAKNGGGGDTK